MHDSQVVCAADEDCSKKLAHYAADCEEERLNAVECSADCESRLLEVLATEAGNRLANCTCWQKRDAQCETVKRKLLGNCLEQVNRMASDSFALDEDSRRQQQQDAAAAGPEWTAGANSNVVGFLLQLGLLLLAVFCR